MTIDDKKAQELLNKLLYHVRESYVDEGFNGPIYHYRFDFKAVEIVKQFIAEIK